LKWFGVVTYSLQEGELLSRILDPVARIKKCGDQLGQTTPNVLTGVAKCIQDDGGISENVL